MTVNRGALHGKGGPSALRSTVGEVFLRASAALAVLLSTGCLVDTEIPDDALLTCFEDEHCPDGWRCDLHGALCVPPGKDGPVDPELAEVRREMCEALYDAAEPCSTELEAALGDEARVFELPRPTFLHLCATEMLADTTVDDIGDLLAGAALVPLLSCEDLADFLVEELSEEEG